MGESPIWKCEVGILDCVEAFQTLIDGLTCIIYNIFESDHLTTSFYNSEVNSIGLTILGSSFYVIIMKEN